MKTSFALLCSSSAFLCFCADITLSLHFTRRISPKLSRKPTTRNTKSAKATSKSAKGAKSSNNSQLPWPSTTTISPTSTIANPSPRPSQLISDIPSMAVSSEPSVFDTEGYTHSASTKVPKTRSSKAPSSRKNPKSKSEHPSPSPSQSILANPPLLVSSEPSALETKEYYLSSSPTTKNKYSSTAPSSQNNPKSTFSQPSSRPSQFIPPNPSLPVNSEPPSLDTSGYNLSSPPSSSQSVHPTPTIETSKPSKFDSASLWPSSRPSQFVPPNPSMPVNPEPPSLDTSGYNLSSSPSSSQSAHPTSTIETSKPSKFDSASLRPSVIPTRPPSFQVPTSPTGTQISILPTSTIVGVESPTTASFASPSSFPSRLSPTNGYMPVSSKFPVIDTNGYNLSSSPSTPHSVHPTQTKESGKPSNFYNASLRPSTIPTRFLSPASPRPTPVTESIPFSELILSLNLSITRRLSTYEEDKVLQMLLHSFCVDMFATDYATFFHCDILVEPSTNVEEGNAEEYILTKKVSGSVSFALQQDLQLPDTKELDARIAQDLQGTMFLDALQNSDDGLLSSTQQVKVYYPSKDGGAPNLRSEAKSPVETEGGRTRRYLSIILSMSCAFISIYIYHTKLRPILSSCRSTYNVQSPSMCSPPAYLEMDEHFDETSILGSNKASLTEDTFADSSNSATPNTRNIKKGDPFRDVKCHHILELDDGSDLMTTGTFEQLWNDAPSVRTIV